MSVTTPDGVELRATWRQPGSGPRHAAVLLAHGLQMDRSEATLFDQLAARLAERGIASLRFDFRGHGDSGGVSTEMTIAGECLDADASLAWIRKTTPGPLGVVGASFGALSAIHAALEVPDDVGTVVLWYPVLDLVETFLVPSLAGARAKFNHETFQALDASGFIDLGRQFRLGRAVVEEMRTVRPVDWLRRLSVPVLTLHGDQDSYVPYAVAREHGAPNARSEFIGLAGAEHGFPRPADAEFAMATTTDWLAAHLGGRGDDVRGDTVGRR